MLVQNQSERIRKFNIYKILMCKTTDDILIVQSVPK